MFGGQQSRAEGFVEYVDARRPQLRRTAYLVCGDWHAAEDLVQTALIKLYAAWPRIKREGSEDAYVRRILVRAHLDERRRPWRRETVELDGFDVPAPETVSFEDGDALMAALKSLPHRQRATVVLRYWCGLSIEETARDLGCSTGTVKSQTARAITSLRAALSSADDLLTER